MASELYYHKTGYDGGCVAVAVAMESSSMNDDGGHAKPHFLYK